MTDFANWFLVQLASASCYLIAPALVALVLLWAMKCKSPSIHAAVWFLVLVQGLVLTNVTVSIPVASKSFAKQSQLATDESTPLFEGNQGKSLESKESSSPTPTPVAAPSQQGAATFSWVTENASVCLLAVWVMGITFFVLRWVFDYARYHRMADWNACDLDEWNEEAAEVVRKDGDGEASQPMRVTPRAYHCR